MIKDPACKARKLMFPIVLAGSLALIAASAVHAEIYKWVDSSGQTQYTQTPPPEGVESVNIETSQSPVPEAADTESVPKAEIKASEEPEQQKTGTARDPEKEAEIARISKQNCITARNNLEQLSRSGQIRYRTGDGEVLRLSEEDRQQRIEEARSQIKEFCKD